MNACARADVLTEAAEVLSTRQQLLLTAIQLVGGRWRTGRTGRAEQLYRALGVPFRIRTGARTDLYQLCELGHLIPDGNPNGRGYRLNTTRKDGQS